MEKQGFLNRQRIGVILRTFAKKEEDVPQRVEAVRMAVVELLSTATLAHVPVARIDVVIPTDPRFTDHDCGKTAAAVREFAGNGRLMVRVFDNHLGDQFCTLLNHAVALQSRDRIDWSLILSTEATSYVRNETLDAMVDAACAGARAIGVAIGELEQSVLEGRLANTFCMWHVASLQTVGGFDPRAAQARVDDRIAPYMRGIDADGNERFYPLHGVEEVIPLARLVDLYGPCIAPILPAHGARYQAPDPATQPELYARHVKKMGTKTERQMAHLAAIGYDLSWLRGGVMEQYRRF